MLIQLLHYLNLGTIDLDIGRCCAISRVGRVSGAYIRYFEHHVRRAVFLPERDANILHAVAWP